MVLIEYSVNSQHTGRKSELFPTYVTKLFLLNHIHGTELGIHGVVCAVLTLTTLWAHCVFSWLPQKKKHPQSPPTSFFRLRYHQSLHLAGSLREVIRATVPEGRAWLLSSLRFDFFNFQSSSLHFLPCFPNSLSLPQCLFLFSLHERVSDS